MALYLVISFATIYISLINFYKIFLLLCNKISQPDIIRNMHYALILDNAYNIKYLTHKTRP